MANRCADWLRQARRDLEHARNSVGLGDYEWACFAAQQAAEKAVKALYEHLAGTSWGHSLLKLIKELPFDVPEELVRMCARLDRLYIPTRYPSSFVEGIPGDFYGKQEAEEAVSYAEAIFSFVQSKIPQQAGGGGSVPTDGAEAGGA